MTYNKRDWRRYLTPFMKNTTTDGQGYIYHYNDPLLGDIYSTACKYFNNCNNVIEYDSMENIAWYNNGINYGSITFCLTTKNDGIKILTIYFESEDAE